MLLDHGSALVAQRLGVQPLDHTGATGALLGGRYRLGPRLDAGGMGAVYEAEDTRLGRSVAVKLVHRHIAEDAEHLERFRREALVTASLSHPNIVQIIDFAIPESGPPYIVMERLTGQSLAKLVRANGPLTVEAAVSLGLQLLSALEVAHRASVTHRDLKPHNVFVVPLSTGRDLVKILDFGIASVKNGPGFERLTRTGIVLGTPATMAPEQARGEPVDARSDVYAAGVVLYFALTGALPFTGSDVAAVLRDVVEKRPAPLRTARPDVGEALATVVHRALEKSPADRWASAQLMSDALRAVGSDATQTPARSDRPIAASQPETRASRPRPASKPPTTARPETREKRRGVLVVVLGAIVICAGVGGGLIAYQLWLAPRPHVPAPSTPAPIAPVAIAPPVAVSRSDAGGAGVMTDAGIAPDAGQARSAPPSRHPTAPILDVPSAARVTSRVVEVFDARIDARQVQRSVGRNAASIAACFPEDMAHGYATVFIDVRPDGGAEFATWSRGSATARQATVDCAGRAMAHGTWPRTDERYRVSIEIRWNQP